MTSARPLRLMALDRDDGADAALHRNDRADAALDGHDRADGALDGHDRADGARDGRDRADTVLDRRDSADGALDGHASAVIEEDEEDDEEYENAAELPARKKTWRRTTAARRDDSAEDAPFAEDDGLLPTAANTSAAADGADHAAIEETAFGLPRMEIPDARAPRKSSLQMLAAAARGFSGLHKRHGPAAAVPARRALWRDVARTVGFTLVFLDAIYVLVSVPFRLGFLFDPWDHTHGREQWTDVLTLFSTLDAIGELARAAFLSTIAFPVLQKFLKRSARRARMATAIARKRAPSFNPSGPHSLFSTRSSVSSAMTSSEALPAVVHDNAVKRRRTDSTIIAVLLGVFPIELVVAAVNYNWLHAARVTKLLIIGYSLTPAYSALLLKCRRFQWGQWLSFSTLSLPFYLFWLGLYLCHLSACGYMLIANIECGLESQYCAKTPIPGSWVLKDNMEQATLWRRYVRTMYWASKTVTTLGQGDLVPTTLAETNYCIVVGFISGLWATSFLASCAFYFSRRDRDIENGVSTRLEQALRFLKSRKVPSTLALQIRNYYQHIQRTRNGIEEHQVLSNLPGHYRSQCSFFVKYRLLAKIPFFSKQSKAFLRSVVDSIENDFFSPKQTILALFDPVHLIIVVRGDFLAFDQSKVCVRIVTQDEWFGEEALFEDSRSKFELQARSFCEILRLSRQHFQASMEKHFPRLKISAMAAQQTRRVAMIPSTDARLHQVASPAESAQGRPSGRSTTFVIFQYAFGRTTNGDGTPWYHPGSQFRKRWRRWKAALLLFVALEVPFEIAFEWRVGFFGEGVTAPEQLYYVLVTMVEVFFYVDWFFRAFIFARVSVAASVNPVESVRDITQGSTREDHALGMAPTAPRDGMVTQPFELFRMYLLRGDLWFDIGVNAPIALAWNLLNQSRYSILTRELMRFGRLLAFGRLVVLKPTMKKIMVEHDLSPASQLLANVVVFCVITANAMACYFYLLADDKDFYDALPIGFDPDVTPIGFNECLEMATLTSNCTWFMYDRSKYSIKARYIRSLHWSLVLLSTVGYGDILSFTNSECLIGFWWIYFGALICYFTSCAVGSVISQITVLRSAQDARIEEITRALVRTDVSSATRVLIRSHYETNWTMNGSVRSEESMMEHLPRSLRHQLSSSLYVQEIRRCYVFSCLGGQAAMLREIALLVSSEIFLPKVTIVENSHLAAAVCILLSGDVELLLPYDSSHRASAAGRRRSVASLHRNPNILGLFQRFRMFLNNHQPSQNQHGPFKLQPQGIPIAALKAGDCFGEEGLLPDNRSALRVTARTLTGTQIAVFTRDSFMSLAGRFPVQFRQIVTLIQKKQEADTILFDTIRANFKSRPKALEFMGMSPSLYCETKPQVNNIITTDTYQYRVWHIVHAIIILYNFYLITFRLAFLSKPSSRTMLALTIVDYITDTFLYVDIYLKWNRFGYEEHGDQIVDLVAIRRRYKKGWLRIDCLSVLPPYYYGDFFFMSVARLPRLLKSLQIFENLDAVEAVIREKFMKGSTTMLSVFDLFKFLIYFLSAAHHVGSIYFFLGRLLTEYGLASSSWMTVDTVISAYPGDILTQYNRAIYWCLETFTVVCFGDVIAQNAGETVYAFCTCIIGWMCIGQVVGRITSLMANIDKDMTEHNARVDNFEKYARENELPQYLRERAIESAEFKSKSLIELNLRSTFEDLPPALHAMLFEEMYGAYVRGVPEFLEVMKPAQLRVLADALVFRIYVTDDIIFEEGRLGSALYIMKEGRAEYFSARLMIVFAAIYEGQLFGDTAFFVTDGRHLSSVRASRSCQVLELERRKWNEIWDENCLREFEDKFSELTKGKLESVRLAHDNIARNFATPHDDTARSDELDSQNDDILRAENEWGFADTDKFTPNSALTQYRSSLQGYVSLLAVIKGLLRLRVPRKIAPVVKYQTFRRHSSKTATISDQSRGNLKLFRTLGISAVETMKLLKKPAEGRAIIDARDSLSFLHHLETIKARFQRRQERTMFDVNEISPDTLRTDPGGTTSEIWVDPPLPPSFCLEHSKFRQIWDTVMFFICLYFVVIVPVRVSFDYELLSNDENQSQVRAWFLVEYIMDVLCIVDFVLNKNYFTFVNRGTLVTEKKAIRDHYLHEGTYLMDLFGILPFEILLPFAPLENAPGTNVKVTWYRVAVFRLSKMVRIAHFNSLGEKVQRILVYDLKVSFIRPSVIYFIRFAFDFALGAHWVACMFYGLSFNRFDDNHDSWLKVAGMLTFEGRANEREVGNVPAGMKYARSYHFSMGAITTISYGDVAPMNAWETFIGTFVIIISMVLFSMLSGGFNQMFEMELGQRADYEEKIASVAQFMMFHHFPTRVWKHMQSYFMVYWSESQGMNEEELLEGLPLSVKNDITLYVKQDFIKQMRLFAGCDEAFVRAVVAAFDRELFVRNDVIITYGERGRSLYVIEYGSVQLRIPQNHLAIGDASTTADARASMPAVPDLEMIKGRFDYFGERSLIFDIPRSATCIALSACSMLILTVDKYDAIIENFPEYREKHMNDWVVAKPQDGKTQSLQSLRRAPIAPGTRARRAKANAPPAMKPSEI